MLMTCSTSCSVIGRCRAVRCDVAAVIGHMMFHPEMLMGGFEAAASDWLVVNLQAQLGSSTCLCVRACHALACLRK